MPAPSLMSMLAARLLQSVHRCSLHPRPFHLVAVRNEAVVISRRKLAQQINQEGQQEVEEWVASGNKRPHLTAADVGINRETVVKPQLKKHTILADIVISAAGIPNLITADMIKEGAAVIDVGINRVHDPITAKPKLVGDVDFEGVRQKAGYITPVPGLVVPMTVAMLMKNTIIAAKKVLRLEE
uniref:Tetrahydrofolate dehydrogenase/cyclohydrolase NAD(P)-binding domain-containing protein n=1 Tax=Cebus imitator TaxID=2715852 RepID=A0A2K5QZE8_CEBIM